MWPLKKKSTNDANKLEDTTDFRSLLRYIHRLAINKLGYPVSLLTFLGIVNNKSLGIRANSLANILLNNVGDPFKDSETSLMEVKKHERQLIRILEKFYGMEKDEARGYVTTGGTEGNFAGLWWSKRYLINSVLDQLIKQDDLIRLHVKYEQETSASLSKIPLSEHLVREEKLQKLIDLHVEIQANKNIVQQLLTPTVFYTKNHTHYSIPKIAEILRLNIRPVASHDDGSMDLQNLKKELILHLGAHPHSALVVIANIGTTITGAIDDVPGIKKILDDLPSKPLNTIHLDGALTGFVLPVIKPFGDIPNYFAALGANSLAVSAHKYPGLSQPCGILLARKQFFEKAFEKSERSIDYVGNISDVTITGSRSGLNVLMFYNALCALGLDKGPEKLKNMVEENITNAKYLYEKLVELYGTGQVYYPFHFNVMFPRPSAEIARKYQLMLTGENATICVLTNVTKKLINQFVRELKLEKESNMTKSISKAEYAILTLQDAHVKSAIELFIKSFCDSEPITKHLNIQYKDYEPFAKEVIQKAVKDGMSVVAVDKKNRVVACAISEDITNLFEPNFSHYPKLKPVFALLDKLSQPFLKGKEFVKGKMAHVWIAIVDNTFRGQGLSTAIDLACGDLAVRKGFDFVYAEFTNDISEKITHHYKVYQLCNSIKYDDFILEKGEHPFKGVKGSAASYVIGVRPGVNIDSLAKCYIIEEN